MKKDIIHAKNVTLFVERNFCVVDLSALVRGGDKIFGAVFDPFDGSIQLHRYPRDQHFLLIKHHNLRTKSPTDERRNDADLPLRQPKHSRESVSNHDWSLRGVPDG